LPSLSAGRQSGRPAEPAVRVYFSLSQGVLFLQEKILHLGPAGYWKLSEAGFDADRITLLGPDEERESIVWLRQTLL